MRAICSVLCQKNSLTYFLIDWITGVVLRVAAKTMPQ